MADAARCVPAIRTAREPPDGTRMYKQAVMSTTNSGVVVRLPDAACDADRVRSASCSLAPLALALFASLAHVTRVSRLSCSRGYVCALSRAV